MGANMIIQPVLKVVAMAIAIVTIVMVISKETTVKRPYHNASIGLAALAIAAHI